MRRMPAASRCRVRILPPGARKSPDLCAGRHAGDVDGYAGHDAGRYRARLAGGGRGYARQHERRRVVDLRREFARCMAAGWRFRAVPRYGIEYRRRGLAWRGRRGAQRGRTGACAGAGRRPRGSWPGGDAKQRDGAGGFTGGEHRRRRRSAAGKRASYGGRQRGPWPRRGRVGGRRREQCPCSTAHACRRTSRRRSG